MFKRPRRKKTPRIETLIGRNVRVRGDIEFSGGVHIEGEVGGSVRVADGATGFVAVSEQALIEGSLLATQGVVNGAVHGDIVVAERVVLGAKARVGGNVHYGAIEMAMGAQIGGALVPHGGTPPAVPAPETDADS